MKKTCKIFTLATLLITVFAINAYAVTINIPADYATIQAGIDAATNGDVVLVQPGTYVENINYNGKLITVASLFHTTPDPSYISQTIIDGNNSGCVVTFENGEDSTAIITGFTITNGYSQYGGGIHCDHTSPSIQYLSVRGNGSNYLGGGIYCNYSSPNIHHVTITDNSASGSGGGLLCSASSPYVKNVEISGNFRSAN